MLQQFQNNLLNNNSMQSTQPTFDSLFKPPSLQMPGPKDPSGGMKVSSTVRLLINF
jgi:hypothetical protein